MSKSLDWTRPTQLLISLLFAFALAGCTVPERPNRDTLTFDPGQGEGVVIIGLYLKEHSWYYKPARPKAVKFYEIDLEQRLLRDPEKTGNTFELRRKYWGGEPVVINDVEYLAVVAPAGNYFLYSVLSEGRNRFFEPLESPSIHIAVEAGQINYIGDYLIELPWLAFEDTVLSSTGRDEKAAQTALASHPNISGEIVQQTPEFMTLDCRDEFLVPDSIRDCFVLESP